MTQLFNIDKVFNETSSIIDRFNSSNKETYMYTSIDILKEFNSAVKSKAGKELYKSISEATSKEEQNDDFCRYFYSYRDALSKANRRFSELVGRFAIDIENLIDANKDVMYTNVNSYVLSDLEIEAYRYNEENLKSMHVPNVDLIALFKSEFDEIGMLMQDLGPIASNADKIKIIVSVYNRFNAKLANDWRSNFCDLLFSASEEMYDNSKQFATNIIGLFRGEQPEEIKIDLATLYEAKSALSEYKEMLDNTVAMCDIICTDIDRIASDVGSTIFRNKDCKLVIDSKTAGVQNREYDLNTYGVNQLDIFMKAKTNQITQALDMILIAISIKMDMIHEYLKRNIDIITKCTEPACADGECKDSEEEEEDSEEEKEDDDDDEEEEEDDDDEEDDDSEDYSIDTGDESLNEEEPELDEVSMEFYNTLDQIGREHLDQLLEACEGIHPTLANIDEATEYLFNYASYRLDMVEEQNELNAYISSLADAPLFEADNTGNAIINSVQKIVPMLKKNWMEFQNNVLNKKTPVINALKEAWDSISKAKVAEGYDYVKYRTDQLAPEIPDFNLTGSMRDTLNSEKDFINSIPSLKSFAPDDNGSYIDKFKNNAIENQKQTLDSASLKSMYDFCTTTFDDNRRKIGNYINKLDAALRNSKVKSATNVNASAIDFLMNSYFNEADDNRNTNNNTGSTSVGNGGNNNQNNSNNTAQNNNQNKPNQNQNTQNNQNNNNNQNQNTNNDKPNNDLTKLKTYINVCSKFIGASMTLNSAAFNEYSKALNFVDTKWGSGKGIFGKTKQE